MTEQCASSAAGRAERIVALDGSEIAPTTKPQPGDALLKAGMAGLAQVLKPFPVEWEKQREQFS